MVSLDAIQNSSHCFILTLLSSFFFVFLRSSSFYAILYCATYHFFVTYLSFSFYSSFFYALFSLKLYFPSVCILRKGSDRNVSIAQRLADRYPSKLKSLEREGSRKRGRGFLKVPLQIVMS